MGLKVNDKVYRRRIKKLQRYVNNRLPKEALAEFKDNTPIDGGNARRRTKITKRRKDGFTIKGDYAYSGVIDRGEYPKNPLRGTGKTRNGYSTQAPKGIVEPTIKWLTAKMKKIIRSI